MKGLLVKDFKLMKVQKNFYFLLIAIFIVFEILNYDVSFAIGFVNFATSMFTLSTISYDEFDNGSAFLFTLPISRKSYVAEKYVLALLLSLGSWAITVLLAIVLTKSQVSETLVPAVIIFIAVLVLQAVMLPIQIKFGGEKGRIALIAVVSLLALVCIGIGKLLEMLGVDIFTALDHLPSVSTGVLLIIAAAVVAVILLISMQISISIMNKKEF
ncbi:MAG: ABC-2 transporter permease [Oscillospiraceae bacterium]|nr:ABC-2 transporter permease [Oscillospiraceae bacterium]